ncbi:MAG: NlpC/P60 family protein [Mesorhizobium sp.]|nr:NlpC/P60 family protein [Mesorhizobium sp.]
MTVLDRRLHAFRDDLADAALAGQVAAPRFVAGRPARVTAPIADLRRAPRPDAGLDTQLLLGDDVLVFEDIEGFAWVQAERDGYVGYVGSEALSARADNPTHIVSAPRTFIYPGPDMKLPALRALSLGSRLAVTGLEERRGTSYALLASGEAVVAIHLRQMDDHVPDYVAVAELLLNVPYLWGGVSAFGIDCSGLVQLSMRLAGRDVLRDSDMQAASIGRSLDAASDKRRGDLVFWKGHAAIMTDPGTILHANGRTMTVALEPLAAAIERIGYLYGEPTGFRRP